MRSSLFRVCLVSVLALVALSSAPMHAEASFASLDAQLQSLTALDQSAYTVPESMHARHPRTSTLEYSFKGPMLSVLAESKLKTKASILLQMDSEMTVGQLLASDFTHSVLKRSALKAKMQSGAPQCALRNEGKAAAAPSASLRSVLAADAALECALEGQQHKAVFNFRTFEQLFPATVKDDAHTSELMQQVLLEMPAKIAEAQAKRAADPAAFDAELAAKDAAREAEDKVLMELAQAPRTPATTTPATTSIFNTQPIGDMIRDTQRRMEEFGATELASPIISAFYPFQDTDYNSHVKWVTEAFRAAQLTGRIRDYPTWSTRGLTGRFDAETGAAIAAGAKPLENRSAQPKSVRMVLASDWASGTVESDYVQQIMMKEGGKPDWTLNAGDIYWSGTPDNVRQTCMGVPARPGGRGVKWPKGSKGSFFVLGNHEMYNRGDAFFDILMPTLGTRTIRQQAGYAALETPFWRILMLDTGFGSYEKWGTNTPADKSDMPAQLYRWLEHDLRLADANDKRGILVVTHHQPNSQFEEGYQLPAKGLADRLPAGRQIVWLFGHEHKLSFYDKSSVTGPRGKTFSYYGRCIGNGGFPTNLVPNAGPRSPPNSGRLVGYDARVYKRLALVVDPDKKNGDDGIRKSFPGWVDLKFTGKNLDISYRTLKLVGPFATNGASDEFARETFTVDSATGNAVFAAGKSLKFNYAHSPVRTRTVNAPELSYWQRAKQAIGLAP